MSKPSTEDVLAFMDDDEREYWETQKGTPEERVKFWQTLEDLWQSIPDPTDDDLKPPYMHNTDWQSVQFGTPVSRKTVLGFHARRWKKQRKAEFRDKEIGRDKEPTPKRKGLEISKLIEAFESEPDHASPNRPSALGDLAERMRDENERLTQRFRDVAKKLAEPQMPNMAEFVKDSQTGMVSIRPYEDWDQIARHQEEREERMAERVGKAVSVALRERESKRLGMWEQIWAEIKKHRGWYIVAFLLGGLPMGIATIWPTLTEKKIPQWLAERGWPRLTTLVLVWLVVVALIAVVIVVRSCLTAMQQSKGDESR